MPDIPTRRMGRTEMSPRALALGAAWMWRDDKANVVEAIRRAVELGYDFIDTYPGHNEPYWGEALSGGRREKVYLQAKVGTHPERRKDFSREGTRWSVEGSLRDLRTDTLDSVLIHDPNDPTDVFAPGTALDELVKTREEGKVRHIGIGVRSHEFHERAIETGEIDIVLTFLDYTLLDQSAARTTLPLAKRHDVGLILASALGMGTLTGVEPNVDVEKQRYPDREPVSHRMWAWCRERGYSVRDFALQFCLAAPVDGVVMVGPANRQQIEEAHASATVDIPTELWAAFEAEFGVGLSTAGKLGLCELSNRIYDYPINIGK